jgi:pimeloyl-ACP methyl ester carboxylesterase
VRAIPPPGTLVDIGGLRLHLHCAGEGSPTVVLDAALGASSLSWSLVQPDLARLSRVCSYDRAGFGWSDPGPMPRTADRIAEELHTHLERLVALIFARRFRSVTSGLVLVDPAHAEDWVTPAPKEQVQIDRGVRLCRYGAVTARIGLARIVSTLVSFGQIRTARLLVKVASRRGLSRHDEAILAPVRKLPPELRPALAQFWSKPHFFEALGSQIDSVCVSAAKVLEATAGGYGDLPLITISSTDPGAYRLRQQDAMATLSTRGRHIMASQSGHWIPLDQPQVVIDAVKEVVSAGRG